MMKSSGRIVLECQLLGAKSKSNRINFGSLLTSVEITTLIKMRFLPIFFVFIFQIILFLFSSTIFLVGKIVVAFDEKKEEGVRSQNEKLKEEAEQKIEENFVVVSMRNKKKKCKEAITKNQNEKQEGRS